MRLILVLALLLSFPARSETYRTTGVGLQSCAQFAEDVRQSPDIAKYMYLSWAQGYLSAVNFARMYITEVGTLSVLQGDTGEAVADNIWNHVRWYCDAHPLADFKTAVFKAE